MPRQEQSTMSLKQEFVALAAQEGANVRERCRRFGIGPPTGDTCLRRYRADGPAGLAERSRRPRRVPTRTVPELEDRVQAVRDAHPTWGGRKRRRRLTGLGVAAVPAASTVTAILGRSQSRWVHYEGG